MIITEHIHELIYNVGSWKIEPEVFINTSVISDWTRGIIIHFSQYQFQVELSNENMYLFSWCGNMYTIFIHYCLQFKIQQYHPFY